jgi:hypothetical protein
MSSKFVAHYLFYFVGSAISLNGERPSGIYMIRNYENQFHVLDVIGIERTPREATYNYQLV